jgi:hypothetical protein
MADLLALHINQLLSLDSTSQKVALNTLTNPAEIKRSCIMPPPGLEGLGAGLEPQRIRLSELATTKTDAKMVKPGLVKFRGAGSFDSASTAAGSQNDSVSESSDHELQGAKREVTTLKIKNLPRRCTRDEVLSAVAEAGFGESYDFFFLPLGGQQSRQNRGYAFVNFKSPAVAFTFRTAFNRFRIREKLVEVVSAPVQGLSENVERYSKLAAETDSGTAKAIMLII